MPTSVIDMSSAFGPSPRRQKPGNDESIETSSAPAQCANCKKPQKELSKPLKRCAKCQTQSYCSRECQKADWKSHKKSCASSQQNKPKATTDFDAMPKQASDFFKGLAGDNSLHDLTEKDAFIRLIDCYRMRAEDDYKYAGDPRGIYDDDDPLPDFQHFLDLAEKRKRLLPKWWSEEKRVECERLARDVTQWACLAAAIEKSDVMEHYGDNLMPMKLRMLAEEIYGKKINMGY